MKRKFTFDVNVLPILVRYIAIRADSWRCTVNETLFVRDQIGGKSRRAAGWARRAADESFTAARKQRKACKTRLQIMRDARQALRSRRA